MNIAKTDGIAEKLHKQSDDGLRARIANATAPLTQMLNDAGYRLPTVHIQRGEVIHEFSARFLVTQIEETLFASLAAECRKQAVDSFLSKVESLKESVEELQGIVNQ